VEATTVREPRPRRSRSSTRSRPVSHRPPRRCSPSTAGCPSRISRRSAAPCVCGRRLQDLQEHARPPGSRGGRPPGDRAVPHRPDWDRLRRRRRRRCCQGLAGLRPHEPNLVVKGGLVGKDVLNSGRAAALAELPSREALLGQIGSLRRPAPAVRQSPPGAAAELRLRPEGLIESQGGVPEPVAETEPEAPASESEAVAETAATEAPEATANVDDSPAAEVEDPAAQVVDVSETPADDAAPAAEVSETPADDAAPAADVSRPGRRRCSAADVSETPADDAAPAAECPRPRPTTLLLPPRCPRPGRRRCSCRRRGCAC